jgi:hypothetical protein
MLAAPTGVAAFQVNKLIQVMRDIRLNKIIRDIGISRAIEVIRVIRGY